MQRKEYIELSDPSSLDQDKRDLLVSFINSNNLKFIERNTDYEYQNKVLNFSHNLITTKADISKNKKFYVISSKNDDEELMLGKGSFSRARKITGSIEVSPEGNMSYQVVTDKAARIKNTQEAQSKRESEPYEHKEALDEYEGAKKFPHLGMEEPVEVVKNKKDLGAFSKSYSVMNALPGSEINKEFNIGVNPASTQEIVEFVILPLLEAYKTQIAGVQVAHRDIKPANVLLKMGDQNHPSIVNFIDMDYVKHIGEKETNKEKQEGIKGTPGYIASELFLDDNNELLVNQSRDIFSLGILIAGLIQPEIEPEFFFPEYFKWDQNDVMANWVDILNQGGGYFNVEELIKATDELVYDEKWGMFEYVFDSVKIPEEDRHDLHHKIQSMLESMTNVDPKQRPSIESALQEFQAILQELKGLEKKYVLTNSAKNSASTTSGIFSGLVKKAESENIPSVTAQSDDLPKAVLDPIDDRALSKSDRSLSKSASSESEEVENREDMKPVIKPVK